MSLEAVLTPQQKVLKRSQYVLFFQRSNDLCCALNLQHVETKRANCNKSKVPFFNYLDMIRHKTSHQVGYFGR